MTKKIKAVITLEVAERERLKNPWNPKGWRHTVEAQIMRDHMDELRAAAESEPGASVEQLRQRVFAPEGETPALGPARTYFTTAPSSCPRCAGLSFHINGECQLLDAVDDLPAPGGDGRSAHMGAGLA